MLTSWKEISNCWGCLPSRFNEIDGRHEETRTPDLYRVKFEVNNLKPFACLAFPLSLPRKNPLKPPSFGDELVTSFPMM
jgi:hypothetical protein